MTVTDDLSELQKRYEEFLQEREFEEYQTPKNVAAALSVEANELLEIFLWHGDVETERYRKDEEKLREIREELADVVIYSLGMASVLDIDLGEAVADKLAANENAIGSDEAAAMRDELDRWR